ncbi:MAG: D-alanyl-D-alanine carboxypeptidase, partial [Proteobacteria bacterium]|nr:D-alanyl-D-alanine carboxypeptidase [Pseudomonadota bacterium]
TSQISARSLVKILEAALKSPYQPEFFASLPLIGIDGTVKKRLKGKIPPGSARIKTGIIDDVRTMAGYVKSKNNRDYIIVSLQNFKGIQNTTGTLIQDELLKWLYNQ